ncbi:MAG: hypothetical protein PWP54_645 [Thermosipho sp. (in: thermotogales)]|nr:hypothetical protein [Thermosipho sp. (in: thermotogales)]MDN5324608.1 hypothetical protein [Thermosipho sp. (in: thermotogales)]
MSNKVFDLLRKLGYNPAKEQEFYLSTLAHIAAELLEYRKINKLSQEQLAEKLGITQAMVSKIETASANLSIKTLAKIAAKLNGYLYVTLNLVSNDEEFNNINKFEYNYGIKEENAYENEHSQELDPAAS